MKVIFFICLRVFEKKVRLSAVKVKQGNTLLMVHLYLMASNWSLVIAKNCD